MLMDIVTAGLIGLLEGSFFGVILAFAFHDKILFFVFLVGLAIQRMLSCLLDNVFNQHSQENSTSKYINRPIPSIVIQWALYGLLMSVIDITQSHSNAYWRIPLEIAISACIGLLIGFWENRKSA
ncbi:Uncharacterised protein [Scardovia inopinata]|uniref:Uncharacterized protein n=1 Tax=Scardovia inopinata F0304 TaxID=641146 RepID=W1MXE2_SCAIO|nr:hypothetical protein [Scardovia inopinata]EQW16356.1 hypothetical protein HMPREF9020_01532 [Scardovia inopinata F0304]BAR06966.1 hypothetical protein SCIP_0899 [Scardovia inopinata JCM 12537]SUV51031.1 Uncharacterised protein [Scardovia inopinata]